MSHVVYEIAADVNPATGAREWTHLATAPDADIARALCLAVKRQFGCTTRLHRRLDIEIPSPAAPAPMPAIDLVGRVLDGLVVLDGKLLYVDVGGKVYSPKEYLKLLAAGELHAS